MFYVNRRWLGGMLTNFSTIRTRIDRLNEIDKMEQNGQFDVLPKKEVIRLENERAKLNANLGGIREMKSLPGAVCGRPAQGSHRRGRSAQAGHSDCGHRGHQL